MNALMLSEQAPLGAMVADLRAAGSCIGPELVTAILQRNPLTLRDIQTLVVRSSRAYSRRRVARTDDFEVLVMTWLPGQGTAPHDHAGSVCGFRIVQGVAQETLFESGPDGLVAVADGRTYKAGELVVESGPQIHAICNDAGSTEALVTVHVYSPPLPELRRFAERRARHRAAPVFSSRPRAGAPTVAVIGGGFSGTMVAAHLVRQARSFPLHVVLFDRQSAIGEGAAYRTPDALHLLNVPAAGMSAWPDRPGDFLNWTRSRSADVAPYDFLPRQTFGEYIRSTFLAEAGASQPGVTAEIRRSEVTNAVRRPGGTWELRSHDGSEITADAIVLATGHGIPDDPLASSWSGSHARYVPDPWSSMALSSIAPDESVLLIGTGLTAVDVVMSLSANGRRAPLMGVSRHGLVPAVHAPEAIQPIDPADWLDPLLAPGSSLDIRSILRGIRAAVRLAERRGQDWRQVIDGLRPHTARIWRALTPVEARRFLRHARVHWDVHRHRMAPEIGDRIGKLVADDIYRTLPGRVMAARGSVDGVSVDLQLRANPARLTVSFDWVVNCTGPGPAARLSPVIASLVNGGQLEIDPTGLGVVSANDGRALAGGHVQDDLMVIGTLRRPSLWESTAVPELRQQAASTAQAILTRLQG